MGTLTRTAYELRDLLQQQPKSCCICLFAHAGVRARIDAIFYEQVTDRDVRATIRAARGFCRRHSHMVSEHADALGTALIMQDILINELRSLEEGGYALPQSGGPLSRLRDSRRPALDPCPLCLVEDELERTALDGLLEGLEQGALAESFGGSTGMCLPHFRQARKRAKDEGTWTQILETERRSLQTLADTLGRLARSSDYRANKDAVTRDEALSWRRGLAVTSGMEEGV